MPELLDPGINGYTSPLDKLSVLTVLVRWNCFLFCKLLGGNHLLLVRLKLTTFCLLYVLPPANSYAFTTYSFWSDTGADNKANACIYGCLALRVDETYKATWELIWKLWFGPWHARVITAKFGHNTSLPSPPSHTHTHPHTRSSLSLRPAWCGERARWVGGQTALSSPVPSLAAPPSPPAVPLTMHLSNNYFHHSRVLSSPETMCGIHCSSGLRYRR